MLLSTINSAPKYYSLEYLSHIKISYIAMQLKALLKLKIWEHTVQKAGIIPAKLFILNFIVHISLYEILNNSFLNN